MSIAWPTLSILLFLLPGFLFLFGFHASRHITQDTTAWRTPGQLGAVLATAVLTHSFTYLLHTLVRPILLDLPVIGPFMDYLGAHSSASEIIKILQGGLATADLKTVNRVIQYVIYYVIYTSTLGFLFGLIFAQLIAKGFFRSLVKHQWAYELIEKRRDKSTIVVAYVMTQIQHNNQHLLYKGGLTDFVIAPDGKISYLVLSKPQRYCLVFGDKGIKTSDVENWRLIGAPDSRLLIEGADIANVVFSSEEYEETKEGTEALAKALSQFYKEISKPASSKSVKKRKKRNKKKRK